MQTKNNRPNRQYRLVNYDKNWPKEFQKRAKKIRAILNNEIVEIHHIGSTAVEGLPAKPQIDLLVAVKDLDKMKSFYAKMQNAGFTPRGDYTGIGEEYFTEDLESGVRLASIHVVPSGHPEIAAQINFREYLRKNAEDRELYAAVKRKLYKENPKDRNAYGEGKRQVIETIRQRAEEWSSKHKPFK